MKDNNIFIYIIVSFLAGGLLVWGAINFGSNSYGRSMMQFQNSNSLNRVRNIDAHFIEEMIPHHEDAIKMSKIALEKASHEELRNLARSIIKSQGDEIDQMTSWYKEWFGTSVPEESDDDLDSMMGGRMGMMDEDTDYSSLVNSEEFDKRFIEEMIPHHQMAVMMANMLKNSTERNEMKKLADSIITSQSQEIDQMREWYKSWEY